MMRDEQLKLFLSQIIIFTEIFALILYHPVYWIIITVKILRE